MKGIMKVLEVVITVLMVLVVYLLVFSSPVLPPDFESINIQLKAFYSLQVLDQNNQLRSYVLTDNTTAIETNLVGLLPSSVNYQVEICGVACTAPQVNSTRLFSVNYIVAGSIGNYNPNQVIIYMWS